MRSGSLTNSYAAAVGLVVSSLVPFLVLTAAVLPLTKTIGTDLHVSSSTMDITVAMATAAYAAGTVLAVQFALHFPGRRMLVMYEAAFVAASIVAASAPTGPVFIGAFVAQGLCTSLMLIAAVPPLVTSWPAEKMPVTAGIMNLCIFGAVAIGPTVGAAQLTGGDWRPLFWGVSGVAVIALIFALLTFEDTPPLDHEAPWDVVALTLTIVGCGSAFYGAGQLQAGMHADLKALLPLCLGVAVLAGLVVHQHQAARTLMPVKALISTVPITGLVIAMTASAAAFGVMEILLQVLQQHRSPGSAAVLFLPEFIGAVVVAGLFGLLFRTRYTPVLALSGLLAVVASAALLITVLPSAPVTVAVVAGILGLGVAASVSPALFLAGLSLQSRLLQRVFAMIELLRGVTAFLVAPILVYLAGALGPTKKAGTSDAVWICLVIAAVGFVGAAAIYLLGRPWLEVPDLDRWQREADAPAWGSPSLFDRIRPRRPGSERSGRPRLEAGAEDRGGSRPPSPRPTGRRAG